MAAVGDYMNPRLVYLREGDRPEVALRPMLDFGIHSVPILDEEHRPVGMVTLRELIDPRPDVPKPIVRTIPADASIEDAARLMVDHDMHHLIVIDEHGHAVGNLSTLDVVRGLVAASPHHPDSIRRFEVDLIPESVARSPR
jgi:CBS domain-containing protein